jgi:hypothetical protein
MTVPSIEASSPDESPSAGEEVRPLSFSWSRHARVLELAE